MYIDIRSHYHQILLEGQKNVFGHFGTKNATSFFTQFAMMETVISGLADVFPHQLRKHKKLFTFASCMIGFVLGIPQVCKVNVLYTSN